MTSEEVRSTPQRRAILQVLQDSADHPTAAEVHERVGHLLPGVGAATVYRSLAMLVDAGQIHELRLGSAIRYDRNSDHHDHLVCDACGRLVDVHAAVDGATLRTAARGHRGFTIHGYDLRIHGVCADCTSTSTTNRSTNA
ncbi:MAG TPA: transcriptional repressor [Mycobacteriales bacterium]|nr:transcriptional repressor [Mycobacteriales bacterium]